MKLTLTVISICSALTFSTLSNAGNTQVPYPDGYRNWTHIKSMVIEPGHALATPFQGIHHIYGNKKAMQGQITGKYQDGSVLVFDLLNYTKNDDTIQEADRKLIGVMHKDSTKYTNTGGWGFEGFSANSKTERLTSDGGAGCFSCHMPKKENDYVYSKFRK